MTAEAGDGPTTGALAAAHRVTQRIGPARDGTVLVASRVPAQFKGRLKAAR